MNESYEFEDRKYVNPTVSRDEQLAFVDNLRNVQQADLNQIVRDTHNLGTDVASSYGGLNGATSLWSGQYLAPKMNTMISGLRATAQAQALSDILANYQNQLKQRYNKAYRDYALRNARNSASSSTSSTGGITLNDGTKTQNYGAGDKMQLGNLQINEEDLK